MTSCKFKCSAWKARAVGAVFGLVCSFSSLAAVFLMFASASSELDAAPAKAKAAPSASEVASKAPARPARS